MADITLQPEDVEGLATSRNYFRAVPAQRLVTETEGEPEPRRPPSIDMGTRSISKMS